MRLDSMLSTGTKRTGYSSSALSPADCQLASSGLRVAPSCSDTPKRTARALPVSDPCLSHPVPAPCSPQHPVSIKFALQNLGASIGGIISFALNIRRAYRGSISNATYVVLIVIMCLGLPFALFLPKASRVERTDGRKVIIRKSPSFLKEFHLLSKLIRIPTVLAIVPLMLYAQWFLSYQWQFNFAYFTVRHRALNSMLFYITGLIAALLFGWLLDWERFTRKTRARIGFIILLVTTGSSWILGQAVQVHFSKTTPTLDWAEGGSAGLGTFTFLWWGAVDPLYV